LISFPFSYLESLIRDKIRKEELWKPIVDNFTKKLRSWDMSNAVNLCTIKVILTSLSLLDVSSFRIPKMVAKKLTQLQSAFYGV